MLVERVERVKKMGNKKKGIALFSGGLDSLLAIKLIQKQGIEVIALYIEIGFEINLQKQEQLEKIAEELGVKLIIVDKRVEYLEKVLFSPKYGYGKNMNPCIDCHIFMLQVGFEVMEKVGGDFLITGEVVGQRPMSQRLPILNLINKTFSNSQLIVRPLSAKLLPPTLPEEKGWIKREELLAIRGRGRQIQLQLAKKFGLSQFQPPAGGCLLTDNSFSKRLRKLAKKGKITPAEISILRVGRHFEIKNYRIIVSRKEEENKILKEYCGERFTIAIPKFPGPVALVEKRDNKIGELNKERNWEKGIVSKKNENLEGKKRENLTVNSNLSNKKNISNKNNLSNKKNLSGKTNLEREGDAREEREISQIVADLIVSYSRFQTGTVFIQNRNLIGYSHSKEEWYPYLL